MKIQKEKLIGTLDGWAELLRTLSFDLRSAKLELPDGRSGEETTDEEDEVLYNLAYKARDAMDQLRDLVDMLQHDARGVL
ncbi:MAG: hypothetical protein CL581_10970 [Alteromonadaceae bacterium]|nr:hypothetical protein [Alteromonadaceae bacterium]MAA65284.1 hypothetical protein [Alteromonadaceae bacterium]|tara:strand:- start:1237 stop:1476 length:240 start_codon:yes stop_codon:yes gene_type:complete